MGEGRRVSRSRTPRRFQSVDDGIRSDRLYTAHSRVSDLPGRGFVRDARRVGRRPQRRRGRRSARSTTRSIIAEGKVFLVQRPRDASLMAGMWELPEIEAPGNGAKPFCTVKHSITVTDYTVRVWWKDLSDNHAGRRVSLDRHGKIALTGLARKILRKVSDSVVARTSAN